MTYGTADLFKLRVLEDTRYVSFKRCEHLRARIQEFWEHAGVCLEGGGSRRRILAVIGASGTGKTTSLRHVFKGFDALKRYSCKGRPVIPMISIEVPRPCTTKDLAIHILNELGVPASHSASEYDLFQAVKSQLRECGSVLLHLDEAQHLLQAETAAAVRKLQDRLKSLLSIPDWPLHLILSGVPELATLFSGDHQLANRSTVMRFENLLFPGDKELVSNILRDIAVDHCSLSPDNKLLTEDFLGRLISASGGGIGTLIEFIRAACYKALSKGHVTLGTKDFAFAYARFSGSRDADNIITASGWQNVDRGNALVDLIPPPSEKRKRSRRTEQ
ncbi:ATP-binding protein [Rhizobium leguminosarum]|uniref:ATP-binding protein n=1 Tax=Rhizobium leguminosarum TaxID=384 RepID=UPI0014420FA0|nr:ATP-binding protein [Rhizobium leguminosarum]NKM95692.1 AAA family ATPase [Rhizobium leguminosarum bv. viciae]